MSKIPFDDLEQCCERFGLSRTIFKWIPANKGGPLTEEEEQFLSRHRDALERGEVAHWIEARGRTNGERAWEGAPTTVDLLEQRFPLTVSTDTQWMLDPLLDPEQHPGIQHAAEEMLDRRLATVDHDNEHDLPLIHSIANAWSLRHAQHPATKALRAVLGPTVIKIDEDGRAAQLSLAPMADETFASARLLYDVLKLRHQPDGLRAWLIALARQNSNPAALYALSRIAGLAGLDPRDVLPDPAELFVRDRDEEIFDVRFDARVLCFVRLLREFDAPARDRALDWLIDGWFARIDDDRQRAGADATVDVEQRCAFLAYESKYHPEFSCVVAPLRAELRARLAVRALERGVSVRWLAREYCAALADGSEDSWERFFRWIDGLERVFAHERATFVSREHANDVQEVSECVRDAVRSAPFPADLDSFVVRFDAVVLSRLANPHDPDSFVDNVLFFFDEALLDRCASLPLTPERADRLLTLARRDILGHFSGSAASLALLIHVAGPHWIDRILDSVDYWIFESDTLWDKLTPIPGLLDALRTRVERSIERNDPQRRELPGMPRELVLALSRRPDFAADPSITRALRASMSVTTAQEAQWYRRHFPSAFSEQDFETWLERNIEAPGRAWWLDPWPEEYIGLVVRRCEFLLARLSDDEFGPTAWDFSLRSELERLFAAIEREPSRRQALCDAVANAVQRTGNAPLFRWLAQRPDTDRAKQSSLSRWSLMELATPHYHARKFLHREVAELLSVPAAWHDERSVDWLEKHLLGEPRIVASIVLFELRSAARDRAKELGKVEQEHIDAVFEALRSALVEAFCRIARSESSPESRRTAALESLVLLSPSGHHVRSIRPLKKQLAKHSELGPLAEAVLDVATAKGNDSPGVWPAIEHWCIGDASAAAARQEVAR